MQLSGLTSLGLATRGLALPASYTGIPAGIRPYLQTPRPDSIWVSWFSNNAPSGQVEWGNSPDALTNTLDAGLDVLGTGYHYHNVRISGLQPDTFYHYRVRNGAVVSDVFRFRTAPAAGSTGKLRVLVMGDNQIIKENRYEKLIACAKAKIEALHGVPVEEAVNFILMPGDQVDTGTLEHYRNLHFKQCGLISPTIPIMTTVGNHETYGGDESLNLYSRIFNYSDINYGGVVSPGGDKYYSYQMGAVAFLHTSSEHTGTQQQAWVRQFVDALKADATTPLCVSVVHRPYQAEQYVGDISGWFRSSIMPMLAETEKHVLNIGAHHHLYARGQTREWPIYHIISGGTAWDQYWGQSTEVDMDDVQKTVANWAWQLLEFDPAARTMEVTCYAEANARLPAATRWNYNSRLIDSFHRRLGLAAPGKPSLVNPSAGPLTLPLTLGGSAFQTAAAGESLNSTWFQIAGSAEFTTPKIDRIRDVENLYGDTGAPLYDPVNIHANTDILKYIIPANALANGTWFARTRHRDTNALWSPWSEAVTFEVTGSVQANPAFSLAKKIYAAGEDITVNFENAPGVNTDWIGIYKKGGTPGSGGSTAWAYLNGSATAAPGTPIHSGSLILKDNLAAGQEWFAGFFTANGYTEVAPRIPFYVGSTPLLALSKPSFDEGAVVPVAYTSAPGGAGDVVSIYKIGTTPGSDTPHIQQMPVSGAQGSRDFADLPKGYYYATYLPGGGTLEIGARLPFSVGTLISTVSMSARAFNQGQPFAVQFGDGPGTPKDWIGLFKAGETPGVDVLSAYLYVGGRTSGSVTFDLPDLPPGQYFAALFVNDSYTEVSSRVAFSIGGPDVLEIEKTSPDGVQLRLRWRSTPGRTYVIQKNTGLSGAWADVRTVMPGGSTHEEILTVDPAADPRAFFRLMRP